MKSLFFFTFLLIAFYCCAQKSPVTDLDKFAQKLSDGTRKQKTIESDFIQYKEMEIMEETLTSSGKFYFRDDDVVSLKYTSPEPYLIVVNGEKVKIETNGKKNIYNTSSNPMVTTMQSMFSACLSGDFTRSKDYALAVFQDDSGYLIEIEPQNRKIKKYIQKIEVIFDKNDFSVNQLIVREPSGDFTKHVFFNKKFNTPLSDQLFEIK
ncbi:MAG: outer membrane lipoprotein carrier protein LolA [Bacteroidales bacterium]|jgi:outer membrane lipoprotein-sorting protein|nr:outer membrane lipoprotein carrier protein LolA [Bacteroidales bacterium]